MDEHSGSRPGWRPSEEHELLLHAALSPPSETAGRWRDVRRRVDPLGNDPSLHELLPLLYRSLVAGGVEDPSLGRLKGMYRRTWYTNQLLLRRAGDALEALRVEGMAAIVLGGAALGLLHYRDAGVRPMSDTRIVVVPAHVAHARAVLRSAGWHDPPVAIGDDDLWARSTPLVIREMTAHALCPEDQLLYTCVYGPTSSSEAHCYRWVADALTILRSSRDSIEWRQLLDRAAEKRVAKHLHLTLAYLRDAFSSPVPMTVIAAAQVAPGSVSDFGPRSNGSTETHPLANAPRGPSAP
jgi:hypothetical protein